MHLDRGALGVEAKPGLALLVGADAVVSNEGPNDRTALLQENLMLLLPSLPSPVQTFQPVV